MRSAVSVILSNPVPDNEMSQPDYEQTVYDHAALLFLLKDIGPQVKPKCVNRLCERVIKSNSRFTVIDTTKTAREIFARFVREHPPENSDWGQFQTHRRLLGLITFGKFETQIELDELCRLHECLKSKYHATLIDSRAIFIGPEGPEQEDATQDPPGDFKTPSNFKATAYFYNNEACPNLETHVKEFLTIISTVLESQRVNRAKEKLDSMELLKAPFEKKEFIALDLSTKNNRKKCAGRMSKHLGDLCLQAGLPIDALSHYNTAVNTLQAVNDWLWLAAALEGLCATSAIIHYPHARIIAPLHRNSSLQEGSPDKRRRSSAALSSPVQAISSSSSSSTSSSPTTSSCTTVSSLSMDSKSNVLHLLPPEDICLKYREAITHYSKYHNAGIIETEAIFKATRISIEQNCALQAASFLKNAIYIHLPNCEQEKISRFTTLSDLYTQFGFSRKAACCLRLAATRHVSPHNPSLDWKRCYNMLLKSISGFKLSLDPVEMLQDKQRGWPVIQIQVLTELVIAANRMGNPAVVTRHLTFLLQTMFDHMGTKEREEFAKQLQAVSQQCEGAPVPLVLESRIVIPPANLTNIPKTKSFALKNLQPHLQPQKIERVKEDHGPFLFTPINFGSLERKNLSKSKVDYLWVDGDICEVSMQLINPLPFELHVSNMRLLTNGVVFESIPESITLPADSGPIAVTLAGTPKEAGDLEISGFSTHTLGVKSNCRLKDMTGMPHPHYSVEVIPALPKIDVSTSLPRTASFGSSTDNIVTSASISLYGGERAECTVTITNSGQVPIDMIEVSVQSTLDASTEAKVFEWSDENLVTQLPLQPEANASITLYLYAATNFITPSQSGTVISTSPSQANSLTTSYSGSSSLPSRLNSPHHLKRQSVLTSSFKSNTNSLPSNNLSKLAVPLRASNIIEGQLKIKYSGGAGLLAGYCRISSIFITIEMLPSVQITNWDVLPAETPSQFYLVLDVANKTQNEMELHYTQGKSIYMEERESCRIPVPVERCPLNKLTTFYSLQTNDKSKDFIEMQKVCAEHIASLVELKWQLLGTDSSGRAVLSGITLARDMLDLVRMSPLQWEIMVNDATVKAQDALTCNLGECVSIGVGICNAMENSLHDLMLTINFYQDHQNGVNNYRLDTRLSIAGANKVMLPTLKESARIYHECRVVFLTAGQYKLDIRCMSRDMDKPATMNSDVTAAHGHTWRYIPPIEITVGDC